MRIRNLFSSHAPTATILIRLVVGAVFLSEGIQKVLFPAELGVGRFTKIGIPAPDMMAPFVAGVEVVCGALVLLGLATRLAAIPLVVDMLVAIVSTKILIMESRGFWAMAHESRVDWSMLLGSAYLLIVGAGRWSMDASLAREPDARRLRSFALPLLAVLLAAVSCARPNEHAAAAYVPVTRELTVTTVPLLVKEQVNLYPFLKAARAKGGVLEGHEVYAFSPSSLTVVEGDTIHFTLINPEDDIHSFVLPDLGVSLPGNTIVKKTYVAKHAGIFPILCAVQEHLPMMTGQLVVLPAAAWAGAPAPARR
jgi:uncharacterized membrane protein YphA (DoxX/SURF4 family)/plastocyanin